MYCHFHKDLIQCCCMINFMTSFYYSKYGKKCKKNLYKVNVFM